MIQESVTENQVTEMLALADLDKDGKINYEGKHANRCEMFDEWFIFWYICLYAFWWSMRIRRAPHQSC